MSALLDGHLSGIGTIRRSSRSFDQPTLIHGAAEGRAITLLNCTKANGGTVNVLPVMTETQAFRADAAVVGCWLANPDEAVFVGIRVEISHLTEWSGRRGLTEELGIPHPDDDHSSNPKRGKATHAIELRAVLAVEVDLTDEGISVAMLSVQSLGPGGKENAWGRSRQVKERTLFEVRTSQPLNAFGFLESLRPMQNLLTLATQSACAVGGRRLIPADADGAAGQPLNSTSTGKRWRSK